MGLLAVEWYGSLPTWLTFLAVVGAALALRGGQLGPAVGYLRDANRSLVQETVELKRQIAEQTALVASLRARTDLEPLQAAMLAQMSSHEQRAQDRFERTCVILDLIAERLGANGD